MHNLDEEFEFCKKYMRELGIEIAGDEKMILSNENRQNQILGHCTFDKTINAFRIYVSPQLLNDNIPTFLLRDTIMHELLHTKPRSMNHGNNFQKAAKRILEASDGLYNILAVPTEEYLQNPEQGFSIIHYCECGAQWYAKSDDSFTLGIDGQQDGKYACMCHICRRKIEPQNKKMA